MSDHRVNDNKFIIKDSGAVVITNTGGLEGTPLPGALEFYNDRMYLTNVATQRIIDRTNSIITSTTTVTNTDAETTIFTGSIPANSLKAGNVLKVVISGIITNATAADDLTITGYIGSTSLGAFSSAIGNLTDETWRVTSELTVRSVGATGSIAWHADFKVANFETEGVDISTVDTTTAEDFTITITWDNAKAGNTISIYQGMVEWKG